MQTSRNRKVVVVAAGLLLLAAACGRSNARGHVETSATRIAVLPLSDAALVTRVTVTVSGGDGPEFAPIAVDLARSGAQWSGRITGIPVGSGRKFDAVAYGSAGARLHAAWGKSDILADAAAVVSILLQNSQGLTNAVPFVSLSASRDHVPAGGAVQLRVSAGDTSSGSPGYQWTAACGAFDDASKTDPIWTAPSAVGPCRVSITATGADGSASTAAMVLNVVPAGEADRYAQANSVPVIVSMSGNITLGATMEGDLSVIAVDPDGDPLAYSWTSSCTGLAFDLEPPFGDSRPHLSMPGPSESCVVTAIVSDDRGGSTTATLTVPPNGLTVARCAGVTCPAGEICDLADCACKAVDRCAGVTCPPASDRCHVAGACDPGTGACGAEALEVCPAGEACNPADGACRANDLCAGVTCPPASDRCHVAGLCNPSSGTCGAEAPRACQTGWACDLADGACKAIDLCAGVTCPPASDRCHVAGACSPSTGACGAQTPRTCPEGQTCDASTGDCTAPIPARGAIADHRGAAAFQGIPVQSVEAAKSSLRIFYGHTSHGSQLVTGMEMLRSSLYDFNAGAGTLSIAEHSQDLGTAGDLAWVETTRARLDQAGSDINVVVWSWCGGVSVSTAEGVDEYLAAMDQLERYYPNVKFVYMTGHTDGVADGALRQNNDRIRNYCAANGKWLFDFEDVESWDPGGTYHPDTTDWCPWCESWCEGHECPAVIQDFGCAHSPDDDDMEGTESSRFNCYLKGQAFWWLLARMAGWSG